MKRVTLLLLGCALAFIANAENVTFEQVRELATAKGSVVEKSLLLEGIVVSDCHSENMALNPNINAWVVNRTYTRRVAYIQKADGSMGMRLVFDHVGDNGLTFGAKVVIDLKGTTLKQYSTPTTFYEASGLTFLNVKDYEAGSPENVVKKEKLISELTDNDVFTFVTIPNVEFIIKDGCYTNVYEEFMQATPINSNSYVPNSRMDGWLTTLLGSDMRAICMGVNSMCQWRRTGNGVPQGIGKVQGVIVSEANRRFGLSQGKYQIRPHDESGIIFDEASKSPYKTICSWQYTENTAGTLYFSMAGESRNFSAHGTVGDSVESEIGRGQFKCTAPGLMRLDCDYTGLTTHDHGKVGNGGLRYESKVCDWYDFSNPEEPKAKRAFLINFSAKKAQEVVYFYFTFGAGNHSIERSLNFPAFWKVSYSLDGLNYTPLVDLTSNTDRVVLRSLLYNNKGIPATGYGKVTIQTGYDAGAGFTEHLFVLPKDVLGAKNVTIKLEPYDNVLSRLHPKWESRVARIGNDPKNRYVQPTDDYLTVIRFGEVTVKMK